MNSAGGFALYFVANKYNNLPRFPAKHTFNIMYRIQWTNYIEKYVCSWQIKIHIFIF